MQSAAPGRAGFEISPLAQPRCAALLPSLSFHGSWDGNPHCLVAQCLRLLPLQKALAQSLVREVPRALWLWPKTKTKTKNHLQGFSEDERRERTPVVMLTLPGHAPRVMAPRQGRPTPRLLSSLEPLRGEGLFRFPFHRGGN